jgi:hypothetical protein
MGLHSLLQWQLYILLPLLSCVHFLCRNISFSTHSLLASVPLNLYTCLCLISVSFSLRLLRFFWSFCITTSLPLCGTRLATKETVRFLFKFCSRTSKSISVPCMVITIFVSGVIQPNNGQIRKAILFWRTQRFQVHSLAVCISCIKLYIVWKNSTWTHSKTVDGLYVWSNRIHWTPEITLEGSTQLTGERNGTERMEIS